MSYTDDFLKELKKRKISIENTQEETTDRLLRRDNVESEDPYTRAFLSELNKYNTPSNTSLSDRALSTSRNDDEDIAPVKEEEDEGWLDFFDKGSFSDGYQRGDVIKAAGATIGDIALGLTAGFVQPVEGITDLILYGTSKVSEAFGNYELAGKAKNLAEKNSVQYVYDQLREGDIADNTLLGRTSQAITQGVGQVGLILATGGLGAAAGLGTQGVTALTAGVMGASGMGSGMSESYQSGAEDDEALTYGVIAGASDAITSLLFGGFGKSVNAVGLSKGLGGFDDILAKKVSSKFQSQIAKNFAEFGVKASGEGLEEVIAGIAQAAGKKATYMSDEDFGEILSDENLLEQFVVGAVTSGIAQSGYVPGMKEGSLREANKAGRDFVTGFSQNEQTVIDKEIENRVAEREKNGEKLTNRDKNRIYDDVVADMEKGRISTDTIESALGGEIFNNYKSITEQEEYLRSNEKKLTDEINTLMNKSGYTMADTERVKEANNELDSIREKLKTIDSKTAKKSLFDEVNNLTREDYKLRESYNEVERRKQTFTADLTKYDEKQRAVVKKAIDSGILNNTNRTHEFVDMVAKISADKGVSFDFTNNKRLKESGFAVDGNTINGFVSKDGVTLNIQSAKALNSVVGHEIAHVLEGTEHYAELQNAITKWAKSKGVYDTKYNAIKNLYTKADGSLVTEATTIDSEVVADLVGDYLFTDSDFVNNLSVEHRNVFQKIYDEIKYLAKIATAGSKEARELERVKKEFDKAYKANVKDKLDNMSGTKLSISESVDTQGRELTVEQKEYFKDSKVVDENGKLKVMYHGTPNGEFTVFKDGTYFTENKWYADLYQNPNASSISTGKKAAAPKTFEVYLDIKKPFDLNDPEARNIYINDYIKGGNAVGINPYLSDAEYDKISSIDWTEGEDLREFLQENGYDYDGLVLDEGAVGGYGEDVKYRGKSYVVFSQEQVKNIDNTAPTSDPDIRFSLSETVEETNDLMALHNLNADELLKSIDLGGLPMPSIAVIKANASHEAYGDVSLILPKETIDPQKNRDNKVYGGDAWTPTYPSIEYKAREKAQKAIQTKINSLVPREVQKGLGYLSLDYENLSSDLNRYNGDMYKAYGYNRAMQYAFLVDNGYSEKLPTTEKQLDGSGRFDNSVILDTVEKLGASEIEKLANSDIWGNEALIAELRDIANENAKAKYKGDGKLLEVLRNRPLYTEKNFGFAQADSIIRAASGYLKNGVEQTVDYKAAGDVIEEAVDKEAYKKWINDLFADIVEKEGIRNNADYYTPSGNRRSWEALHWENTLENVLKVMKAQNQTGEGFFGGASIFGVANKTYRSIEEIKADSDRLRTMSEEEYDALKESFSNRLVEIADSIKDPNERNGFIAIDHAVEEIVDAVRANKTKSGILRYMSKWNKRVTAETVDEIVSLVKDISNMPTGYFEAKPQRAVGFDEIGVFVIPNNADAKLKQELLNRGYAIAEYDPNIEGDRQKVVNSFEEYKFSLSSQDEQIAPIGNFNIYGKDVMLEEDIAPVAEVQEEVTEPNGSNTEPVQDREIIDFPSMPDEKTEIEAQLETVAAEREEIQAELDRLGVMTDEEQITTDEYFAKIEEIRPKWEAAEAKYNSLTDRLVAIEYEEMTEQAERLASLDDTDAPPEVDNIPYDDEPTVPDNPFEGRDYNAVGNRKVKAYMFENPEVKPFFQTEANIMIGELDRTTKGERIFNADLYYESGGAEGWGGTKRHTSDDIAYLLDSGYTYAEIEKGLKAIIEDNGKENIAIAKRIEFMLNDRLLNGYVDFFTGEEIPANQDYIALQNEKQAAERNEEAFNDLVKNADQYAPEPTEADIEAEANQPEADLFESETIESGEDMGQQKLFEEEPKKKYSDMDLLEKRLYRIDKNLKDDLMALRSEYEQNKAKATAEIKDKNAYISKKADALYKEIAGMRKGVRVSQELGNLLDFGFEYKDLKTALVHAKQWPNRVINENSVAESVLRQYLNEFYEAREYEVLSMDQEYNEQVKQLEEAAEVERKEAQKAENSIKRSELHAQIIDRFKNTFNSNGLDFDEVIKKGKNLATIKTVDSTPVRVNEKAFGSKAGAILNELTINQVALNESKATKWLDSFTNRKTGLLAKIANEHNIKPGSKEDSAAQMYAEGFYVNGKGEYVAYSDSELAKDFPDAKVRANIKALAKDTRIRQIYDDTLAAINESRVRNAYPEIPRRENYFRHFREETDFFSKHGIPFNPDSIKSKDLPTDINGRTIDLKPGQPFFSNAMQRKGNKTSYSLLGGLEGYLQSAKSQIYHIDDIQNLRALQNYLADSFGQMHGLEGLDDLPAKEQSERIKEVMSNHMSSYVAFLNEEANIIAGKTALIDRAVEGVIGRRGLQFLNTLNGQVGKNMVGFNVSSALTGFEGVAAALPKLKKYTALKAFSQLMSNKINSINGKTDGFAENNPALIRRRGADRFNRKTFEKISDAGYALMSGIDNLSAEFIVRAKYNELIEQGMSKEQANINAGEWAMRILGDRTVGQQPLLYNSKTLGIITKFQLEVRNRLDSMFFDTIQDAKLSTEDIENTLARNAKKAAKITSTLAQSAVFLHLFGKAFESMAGYNPTFDIISTLIKLFGFDDEEEDEDTTLDNVDQAFQELMGDLPYVSVLSGGRIPLSEALPIKELIEGKDSYGNEKPRWETLLETAPYWVMPGGYSQAKKTAKGLGMFTEELPGSYTDSGNLRYPVEQTPLNVLQAGLFGQYANENARAYFNDERSALKENQIEEFAELDIPISEYWEYRDGLKDQKTLEEKFDYINSLDLPEDKKNILINNIVDRKEDVDLSDYDDFSGYDEFDFAAKNPEKYEFFGANNISYEAYNASDDSREAYNWAYNNPEKYVLSKAISSDVVAYRQYTKALNDLEADKDENGKTISGSRKDKVISYINSMDADYGAKLVLFKSEYKSDDTYNEEIVEYLNNRADISYEEMVVILHELGFTVSADGRVYWD